MKITFIQTGGSIDKIYPRILNSYGFDFGEPAFARILRSIDPNFDYQTITAFKKDSLDITAEDREYLKKICLKNACDKIIITHGTDAMVKTAEFLSDIKGKVIILLGTTRPECVKDTDADFNVGVAVGAINVLNEGVYIAMSGRVYRWNECEKAPNCKFVEKKR